MEEDDKPYIPAGTKLPEVTVKALLLGLILSAVLAAANTYMGLLVGMTVSASIPAAVISMAVLRLFRTSNILENNIVQTAASAGESLAAGVIFTIPALVIMGSWTDFNYLETTLIALAGGVLGVLFTIPLRKALIVKERLLFPEGLATAEVLKVGNKGGKLLRFLVRGSLIGAAFKFVVEGLLLLPAKFQVGTLLGGKFLLFFGSYITPAIPAVGYIVGLNIATLVFVGGAISWFIGAPIMSSMQDIPEGVDAVKYAGALHGQIRFLGVGAMIVGGLWAIISIRQSLVLALRMGIAAFSRAGKQSAVTLRTEYDTPMSWVILGIGIMIIPIFIIYHYSVGDAGISAFMAVIMVFAGFLFSAVAGYMAGLVGSSNNPISGVTIATVLTSSLILLALLGSGSATGPASAILIGAVVCCAAAIAGDNMQDLKAGYILGATPRNQQIMQMVGVIAAAFVMAPVLNLLNDARGIGPGGEISAPQASLMASVAAGVFGKGLPWGIIAIGAAIGVAFIVFDLYLKQRGASFRAPVLAVAVGLYLPLELDTAIFLGGLVAWGVDRYFNNLKERHEEDEKVARHSGLLFASGLITGEALLGIALAIPIAATENPDVMRIFGDFQIPGFVGFLLLLGICFWMYRLVINTYFRTS